jgi:hypothetical protein
MLVYILAGITSAYFLNLTEIKPEGAGYICGFILGITFLALLQITWNLIRLGIED